jgi:isopentenyl phosphate kinase
LSPVRVVKIGGSLVTVKSAYCTLNSDATRGLAAELSAIGSEARADLIIVVGGGSFGNGVPLRHGLDDPADVDVLQVSRMTLAMFDLMGQIVAAFRDAGVAAYPLQASALVSQSDGHYELNVEPFLALMRKGIVPLVTGDLLPVAGWPILSSDWMPVLMAMKMPVSHVAYLTDVPGLLTNILDESSLLSRVSAEGITSALNIAGGARHDVTGGMNTKVRAAARLLELGVPTLFCDGRAGQALTRVLRGDEALRGTRFVPQTVARSIQ